MNQGTEDILEVGVDLTQMGSDQQIGCIQMMSLKEWEELSENTWWTNR